MTKHEDSIRAIMRERRYAHEANRIRDGRLIYRHASDGNIYFSSGRTPGQRDPVVPSHTSRYWYRAMTREQYNVIRREGRLPPMNAKDYWGIGADAAYVLGHARYYNNRSTATHVIEFIQKDDCARLLERRSNFERLGISTADRDWIVANAAGDNPHNIDFYTVMMLFGRDGKPLGSEEKRRQIVSLRDLAPGTPEFERAKEIAERGLPGPKKEDQSWSFGLGPQGHKRGIGAHVFNVFLEEECFHYRIIDLKMRDPGSEEDYYAPSDAEERAARAEAAVQAAEGATQDRREPEDA